MNEEVLNFPELNIINLENIQEYLNRFKDPQILEKLVDRVKSHYEDSNDNKFQNLELAKLRGNVADFFNMSLLYALYKSFKAHSVFTVKKNLPVFIKDLNSLINPFEKIENFLGAAKDDFWALTEDHLNDFINVLMALKK